MIELLKDMKWVLATYFACLVALGLILSHFIGNALEIAGEYEACNSSCLATGAVDYEYANQNCFCIVDGKATPLEQMTPLCDAGTCEIKETNETSK